MIIAAHLLVASIAAIVFFSLLREPRRRAPRPANALPEICTDEERPVAPHAGFAVEVLS